MSASELDFASAKIAVEAALEAKSTLRLQRDMTRVAATAPSRMELLAGLLDVVTRHAAPLAAFFFERGPDGKLGEPHLIGGSLGAVNLTAMTDAPGLAGANGGLTSAGDESSRFEAPPTIDRLSRQVASAARNACRGGEIELRRHALPPLIAVAAPVPRRGLEPHACGAVFRPAESPAQLALLWQLLVSHIVLWEALHCAAEHATSETNAIPSLAAGAAQASPPANATTPSAVPAPRSDSHETSRSEDGASQDSDATIELMERALAASTTRQAGQALCESLREYLDCERVLIGLRSNDRSPCRLAAISQVARFDRRGESIRLMEAAMNEALLRGSPAMWPPGEDGDRHALLAHKSFANSEHAVSVLSVPLSLGNGTAVGVLTLTFASKGEGVARNEATAPSMITARPRSSISDAARLLAVAAPSLALVLDAVRQREGGVGTRLWRTCRGVLSGWRSVAVAGAAIAGIGAMAAPWPYRVACECRVEPAVRRFVVAPYDGVLERVFAKPGEVVEEGQLLARLEDRVLRLERPAIEAELHQAAKKRDVALAKNDSSARQIAELEIRQFASKLRLLDDRADHLELLSPVKGVIASGDLERAEGATLEEGQSLFEIVLLDRMIVEIAVPDDEISHLRPGQTVDIRLDAYPGRAWEAPLERVQPRAEIRDEQNVFVAEIELSNADERLRPGMKGRAKVATESRPIGWILFHKPWEYVVKRLAW